MDHYENLINEHDIEGHFQTSETFHQNRDIYLFGPLFGGSIVRTIEIKDWKNTCGQEFNLLLDGRIMHGTSTNGKLEMRDVFYQDCYERSDFREWMEYYGLISDTSRIPMRFFANERNVNLWRRTGNPYVENYINFEVLDKFYLIFSNPVRGNLELIYTELKVKPYPYVCE